MLEFIAIFEIIETNKCVYEQIMYHKITGLVEPFLTSLCGLPDGGISEIQNARTKQYRSHLVTRFIFGRGRSFFHFPIPTE